MSIKKGYGSDLTDTQWKQLKKYLPKAKSGGQPREVDLREIMNAIFYINKTSCPWMKEDATRTTLQVAQQ